MIRGNSYDIADFALKKLKMTQKLLDFGLTLLTFQLCNVKELKDTLIRLHVLLPVWFYDHYQVASILLYCFV